MQFRYAMFTPPGGKCFYHVPETGRFFETTRSLLVLLDEVKAHYAANSLHVPSNLQALVEDYICMNVTGGFCMGDDPRKPGEKPLSFFEISDAVEKMFRGKSYQLATTLTASNRATHCSQCRDNSLGLCTSCNGLRSLASKFVGKRTLPQDAVLGVCRSLRIPVNGFVHVAVPSDVIDVLTAPEYCWAYHRGSV